MKACATAGGGVMFIPDTIERKDAAISYKEILQEETKEALAKPFGKRRDKTKPMREAA